MFSSLIMISFSTVTRKINQNTYLLLTEFEGRTVTYGPSFFPFAYGPSTKRAGHKLKGKTRIRNLQYGPRNEVSKIFIISLRLIGRAEKEIFKVSGPYSKSTARKIDQSQRAY